MSTVRVETVKMWVKDYEWLRFEEARGYVTCLYCTVCLKHEDKVKALRNYSSAFINGVTGTAIKKDGVVKHSRSDMHTKAVNLTIRPQLTLHQIYQSTPIGRAMAGANAEETKRLSMLFDIAYVIAKEELPFTKYPALVEVEKRHGIQLGTAYTTEHKCSDFTHSIGETMRDEVLTSLKQSKYFTVLMDGSTDSSITEKELVYIMWINVEGKVECGFLRLKDVSDGTAVGLKSSLEHIFAEFGIENFKDRMVCLCADGAAVNMGVRGGLATLLRKDNMDWLIAMHCFNHRLELGVKDAFAKTYMDEISDMLTSLYYVYEKSPKRLRELRGLAEIMDESVKKPEKAHGTRWLQHKSKAIHALLSSYPVIVAHLESMAAEAGVKADASRFKGYLKKLTSVKFLLHMLFFEVLLNPLAALSCHLQGDTVDLLFAMSTLEAFYDVADRLKLDDPDKCTDLSNFIALIEASNVDNKDIKFKGVHVTCLGGSLNATITKFLEDDRSKYIDSITKCVQGRFEDLKNKPVFLAVKLLDPAMWPTEKDAFKSFGHKELSLVTSHFRSLLEKENVTLDLLLIEFDTFKNFWLDNLKEQGVSKNDIWAQVLTSYSSKFPNLVHVIQILLVFPVSNAKVERGFSAMRRIKSDWRCSLGQDTLDHLMRISIEGPPLASFDPKKAVERFFSTPRRPSSRNLKRTADDDEDV